MGAYNVQVYDYEDFVQYRIYKKPVIDGFKREEIEKHEQTEEQARRSRISSLNRTKQSIYEFAYNNTWDLFITFTFAPDKTDRKNYDEIIRKTTQWFNNVRKRKCSDLKYLIVPEMHEDGAFHIHGLLANCDGLDLVDSGRVASGKKACVRTSKNEHLPTIYNIDNWKWGFSTATRVVDNAKCCSYICKYITKEMCIALKGKRRFLQSRNCKRVEVEKLNLDTDLIESIIDGYYIDGLVDYEKTQEISQAGQAVRYVTVKKNVNKV